MNRLTTLPVVAALLLGSFLTLPGCGEGEPGPGTAEPLQALDGDDEPLALGKDDSAKRVVPAFDTLWANYAFGEADEVKDLIGGAVDADWITNTCVVRVSRALNYSGFAIPRSVPGLLTVKGGDSKRYALRVAEFRRYVRAAVGKPDLEIAATAPGAGVDPAAFAGERGLIAFEVTGWSDATGHFDLWDGTAPAHAEYFAKASKVQLWRAP